MITNYHTLRLIAADMDRQLAGSELVSSFSQNKDELVLGFRAASGATDEEISVIAGCSPSSNFVYARGDYHRARRNSINLFGAVIGESLRAVRISPADRELQFRLSSGRMLLIQMFGSKANVLLCDAERVILDSFLKPTALGMQAVPLSARPEPTTFEEFRTVFRREDLAPNEPVRMAFKRLFPRDGNVLVREQFHRAGISPELSVPSLTDRDLESLFHVRRLLLNELASESRPCIYYDGTAPVEFAIIPLAHLEQFRTERFDSIHSGIRAFLGTTRTERTYQGERDLLTSTLLREFEQTERTLTKLAAESVRTQDADELERMGKILTAHLHELTKGMSEAILEDARAERPEIVQIPLDPRLSPAKNAERLFDRAKKMRRTADEQRVRVTELRTRREELFSLRSEAEEVDSTEELRRFLDLRRPDLERLGIRTPRAGRTTVPAAVPFRVFVVVGGFQVWAGKSGENNDLLSTRHTAKNDLWFHARGVGGSHVVLKVGTGKGEVSKAAIQQAAGIAAYYSKMKNASLVPVTMCEGKYVRKTRGAPAGTVTVEREKTIFAEPALPHVAAPSGSG